MKIVLLGVKTTKELWFKKAAQVYIEKISVLNPFEEVRVNSPSLDRNNWQHKRKAESTLLLNKITNNDYIIVCDENGQQMSSPTFATALQKASFLGKKRVVIIVGGAYGIEEDLKKTAHIVWSFSKLTFNHLIANLIALEQIYRALTIQKNLPYHN